MRKVLILGTILAVMGVLISSPSPALGDDLCSSTIFQEWEYDRDGLVRGYLNIYLGDRSRPEWLKELRRSLLQIFEAETRMLVCVPPRSLDGFYLITLRVSSEDQIGLPLFLRVCRKQGMEFDVERLFAGKLFTWEE